MVSMSEPNRLLNFPTTDEDYADQLRAAMDRVKQAELVLRLERRSLERLLLTNEPEGRTH